MYSIAAMSANRVIGNQNKIPWRSKEDMAFFREKTLDKDVLVGAKTFLGMPSLKRRHPIIIFDRKKPQGMKGWEDVSQPGHYTFTESSPTHFKDSISDNPNYNRDNLICIGGAKTYEMCLPYCDSLFLTIWNFHINGDAFMPPFEHLFPIRKKIKDIENETGTIWEYQKELKCVENS